MNIFRYIFLVGLLIPFTALAQNEGIAVRQWKSFYCYYATSSAAISADEVFCGTSTGFFTLDLEDKITNKYSKVNGMNDANVTHVAYDAQSKNVLIAYKSSNMDIFKNGTFRNVPDIMTSSIPGDKTINHVMAYNNRAYVSTTMGMVVVNLVDANIDYTTPFYEDGARLVVLSTAIKDGKIYTSTSKGVFAINIDNALIQDFTKWEKITDIAMNKLTANATGIYGVKKRLSGTTGFDSVYRFNSSLSPDFFYRTNREIGTIDISKDGGVWIGENYNSGAGNVTYYTTAAVKESTYEAFFPSAVLESNTGELFFSDYDFTETYGGLRTPTSGNKTTGFAPSGPESPYSFDVWAYNSELWIAHGGHDINWKFNGNRKAFSVLRNSTWKNFSNQVNDFGVEFLSDATKIHKDLSTGKVYVGMVMGGLIIVDKEDKLSLIQDEPAFGEYVGHVMISGIAQDDKGNIWFNNYGAAKPLRVKDRNDNWYAFNQKGTSSLTSTNLIIDDYGNKWSTQAMGGGVYIFNDGGTLDNESDDEGRWLRSGGGSGNLPSNVTMSIAKDKDGQIWIGTNDGICFVENPQATLSDGIDAKIPEARFDEESTGGKVFQGKTVTAIAVDGNNNKWIGTNDAGVWLLNESATEIIEYFNKSNSPLPDNQIFSIDIDPVTGDVYFSTGIGVVAYRGDAVEPLNEYAEELVMYPNPVPSGYEGMIAIKGLKGNTEIRITDITGSLVAQFSTQGGQAVWDGKDYTGKRPQSGVYLVFATDKSIEGAGKTKKTGKIIIHE